MKPVYRPWGSYAVLAEGPKNLFKIIHVQPGQRLSYQYHDHRSEDWFVMTGTATVTKDGERIILSAGDRIHIPVGCKHRIANEAEDLLQIIEVQTGDILVEEDIHRLQDDYGRIDEGTPTA